MRFSAETVRLDSGRVHCYRVEVFPMRNTRLTVYVWPHIRIKHRLPVDVFCDLTGLWLWLAGLLPRRVIYWATLRALAHATTGRYSDTHLDDVSGIEVLKRWDSCQGERTGARRSRP